MGLGRLCHFFLEIAKSKSPHQGIFIYVLYDYWGQCLSEFSYVVSSSLIWIGVPFLTGVCGNIRQEKWIFTYFSPSDVDQR